MSIKDKAMEMRSGLAAARGWEERLMSTNRGERGGQKCPKMREL